MIVMATTPVRMFNLVVPLAHEATAMRITDTAGQVPGRSGAVSPLSDRPGDVDSTMERSTPATTLTPGTRASAAGIRAATTRTAAAGLVLSAD